jgi:fumarate reductase subunit D
MSTNNKQDAMPKERMPLGRKNYAMMLAGVVIITLGFLLMSGGGEHTATEFDESIFSFRRITLAPIVVIAGFVFEIFAIMKRFPEEQEK